MAMKVNPRLNAPIPLKEPPEKKLELVMLVAYCDHPSFVSGETTTVGAELKDVLKLTNKPEGTVVDT